MITINYEIRVGNSAHSNHGEAYRFATKAAAKAWVTRTMNATYGRGNWGHVRPPMFFVE